MPRQSLLEFLLNEKLITQEQFENILKTRGQFKSLRLTQFLVATGIISQKTLQQALSRYAQIPEIDLQAVTIEPEVINLVPKNIVKRHFVMPVKLDENGLTLAVANPYDLYAIDAVQIATGYHLNLVLSTEADILKAISKYYDKYDESKNELEDEEDKEDKDNTLEDFAEIASEVAIEPTIESEPEENLEELTKDRPLIVRLAKSIFSEAVRMKASDIHIEPRENQLGVRYRVDGILRHIISVNKSLASNVIARIKIMSGMDISVRYKPQDGRTRILYNNKQVDLRVSTLPTIYGEKVVIRLLDKEMVPKSLSAIGLLPEESIRLRSIIKMPHGAIIVTGPTGSGKTSTLYAMLSELNSESVNVVTVEDPIEYEINGINQVQVNEKRGLTFANTLRAILRQDPNVVMVGEIRDAETAEIAFRAALTGHLVLSTLHTNTALYSISRLIDMEVQPYLISSALVAIIAQRLVRKICDHCKERYKPNKIELANKLGLHPDDIPNELFRGKGCRECDFSGYKGRVGIFEMVEFNNRLRDQIGARATSFELFQTARASGMKTLAEDGLLKVFMGLTTIEEVSRMTKIVDINRSFISSVVQSGIRHVISQDSDSDSESESESESTTSAKTAGTIDLGIKIKLLLLSTDASLSSIFDQKSCSVVVVKDPEGVLRVASIEKPDLIIADAQLTNDNGEELIKELKSRLQTKSIPILAIFPNEELSSTMAQKHTSDDLRIDDYLIKPIDPKELLNKVNSILGKT